MSTPSIPQPPPRPVPRPVAPPVDPAESVKTSRSVWPLVGRCLGTPAVFVLVSAIVNSLWTTTTASNTYAMAQEEPLVVSLMGAYGLGLVWSVLYGVVLVVQHGRGTSPIQRTALWPRVWVPTVVWVAFGMTGATFLSLGGFALGAPPALLLLFVLISGLILGLMGSVATLSVELGVNAYRKYKAGQPTRDERHGREFGGGASILTLVESEQRR